MMKNPIIKQSQTKKKTQKLKINTYDYAVNM